MTFIVRALALLSLIFLLSFRSGEAADSSPLPAPAASAPANPQCTAMGVAWDGYVFWAGCPTHSCTPVDCQYMQCENCGAYWCHCPGNQAQCIAEVKLRDDGTVESVICRKGTCGRECATAFPPGPGQKFYFCKC